MESNIRKEESSLKVGDRITVEIGPVAHGGHFIARHKGQVVFVRYGITGEEAVVEITSTTSKLARGDAIAWFHHVSMRCQAVVVVAISSI
jgi:tRNA/tmRNA/rRNA uracil-C5-methylase (TrmA/RlmC/RlmD family)